MRIGILDAGLAGISVVGMLQTESKVPEIKLFEKAPTCGGLAKSFRFGNVADDCGSHIILSKAVPVLGFN